MCGSLWWVEEDVDDEHVGWVFCCGWTEEEAATVWLLLRAEGKEGSVGSPAAVQDRLKEMMGDDGWAEDNGDGCLDPLHQLDTVDSKKGSRLSCWAEERWVEEDVDVVGSPASFAAGKKAPAKTSQKPENHNFSSSFNRPRPPF